MQRPELWAEVALRMPGGKTARQCSERYYEQLAPEADRQPFSDAEDEKLIQLHLELGNRWSEIAERLGRTPNSVKNRYYSAERRIRTLWVPPRSRRSENSYNPESPTLRLILLFSLLCHCRRRAAHNRNECPFEHGRLKRRLPPTNWSRFPIGD